MDRNRLVKHCYVEQTKWADNGISCWALEIKNILAICDMNEYWINQEHSVDFPLKMATKKLSDVSFQELKLEAENLKSLVSYANLKTEPGLESYIQEIKSQSLRSCLLKFRLGIFHNRIFIQNEEKKCKLCENTIEHMQIHLIRECSPLRAYREKFCIVELDDNLNIEEVLNLVDSHIALNLAKYLQQSYRKFDEKEKRNLEILNQIGDS